MLGYEILNEPPLGNLPRRTWAIQRIVRWQARVGAAVRAVDPERAIVFMLPPRTDVRALQLTPLERLGRIALDVHDYYAGTGKRYRTTLQGGTLPRHPRQPGQLPGAGRLDRPHLGRAADRGRVGGVPGRARGRPLPAADGDPVPAGRHQLARWSLDRNERLGLLTRDGTADPGRRAVG